MKSGKEFRNISIRSVVKSVPFYLVTGFLGSGKTTFLKNLLKHHSSSKRIAVIQNEFAASGTDSKELELTGHEFKLVELNNGSVFCVCMMGNFATTLEKMLEEYHPDLIFLESSGLSDPINILEILHDEKITNRITLRKIVTIADAQNLQKALKMIKRVRHQMMIADQIIINKTDIFEGDLKVLKDQIAEINPFAEIIDTSFCALSADKYLAESDANHAAANTFGLKTSGDRPEMKALVLRTNDKPDIDELKAFITELQPDAPRIKGYVQLKDGKTCMVQSVFDSMELRIIEGYVGPSEIIAFSEKFTPRELRDAFKRFAS